MLIATKAMVLETGVIEREVDATSRRMLVREKAMVRSECCRMP